MDRSEGAAPGPPRPSKPGRRPMLLLLVFGVFLVLVGVTGTALAAVTSSHLTTATVNASVERDASLIELFVNGNLRADDLDANGPGVARTRELGTKLEALTREDDIVRIEVRSPDGLILFASDPDIVGERVELSAEMQQAVSDLRPTALLSDDPAEDVVGLPLPVTSAVREYLPIVDEAGETRAVIALWRDAGPMLAGIEQAQRDVVIVVLGAAAA